MTTTARKRRRPSHAPATRQAPMPWVELLGRHALCAGHESRRMASEHLASAARRNAPPRDLISQLVIGLRHLAMSDTDIVDLVWQIKQDYSSGSVHLAAAAIAGEIHAHRSRHTLSAPPCQGGVGEVLTT